MYLVKHLIFKLNGRCQLQCIQNKSYKNLSSTNPKKFINLILNSTFI